MSAEGEEKVVCVTGATGYMSSWLVKILLQQGYTVKASVRSPGHFLSILHCYSLLSRSFADDSKTEHLRALDGAKERLQLFKANLLEEGSFDSAVDGCPCVFHVASPVVLSSDDPQAELIDPAVDGTLTVLRSCSKIHSIKRIVVTSSMASILYNGTPLNRDSVVDEIWFSNPDICKELKNFYALSKTLAEDAAWRFAKGSGIDLVTIYPGLVIGPLLQPNLNASVEVIQKLILGAPYFPSPYRIVDVRDVAYAHIQVLELPTANGRYALVARVTHDYEFLKVLRENYPSLQLPERSEDDDKYEPTYQVSKERAKSLGINFMPWELSLKDTVESLREKGFLQF